MIFVQICVGSSCHLKGAPEIVELMKQYIEKSHLEEEIILSGSFCMGKCNRIGVTVTVNDEVYPGVTKETFPAFWEEKVLPALNTSKT